MMRTEKVGVSAFVLLMGFVAFLVVWAVVR